MTVLLKLLIVMILKVYLSLMYTIISTISEWMIVLFQEGLCT